MRRYKTENLFIYGVLVATVLAIRVSGAGVPSPVALWTFDHIEGTSVPDILGNHPGTISGSPKQAAGVDGQSLVFAGAKDCVSVPDAPELSFVNAVFSLSAWVNVYAMDRGQQIVIGKNNYAAERREWSLMVDKDNRFGFYLYDKRWRSLGSKTKPEPGQWYHLAVTVDQGFAHLYVNGVLENEGLLGKTLVDTAAPLTIGGVWSGKKLKQTFHGAVDEVLVFPEAIDMASIRLMADRKPVPHPVEWVSSTGEGMKPATLWTGDELPKSTDIPILSNVSFHVIEPEKKDCHFLLGVGLVWHKGRLYASFGYNSGKENTATEKACGRVSDDGGKTWGDMFVIDDGEGSLGVSHGVFLSHKGILWAFQGAFFDRFQRTHTRAYVLDETTGAWQPKGVVVGEGFWPMQEPLKMADGNWIMCGFRVAKGYDGMKGGHPPAVAISHGDDFTKWDLVVLPRGDVPGIWGESTLFINGDHIVNISRWGPKCPRALVSTSEDYGRTWKTLQGSNLPMANSKPYAGTLSTGQHYLVCTTTADSGTRRSPLTIAVTRPGEETFSNVFVIRHAVFPEGPGPSDPEAKLCYPYAVEHEGRLYVGYSVKNHRMAELAVIPIEQLECP